MVCGGELLFQGRGKLLRKRPPTLLPNFIFEPMQDLESSTHEQCLVERHLTKLTIVSTKYNLQS